MPFSSSHLGDFTPRKVNIMTTMLAKITREPALILAVVTSGLSLAALFGADITSEQAGGVGIFVAALIALLRLVSTPSSEVIAQVKPGGQVVAGDAAAITTGEELAVTSGVGSPVLEAVPIKAPTNDEAGAIGAVEAVLIVFMILVLLVLLGAIR